MKNGDISNREAPYVGFDIDTLLYLESKKNIVQKLRESLRDSFTNYKNRDLNLGFKKDMQWMWDANDVSIVFLTNEVQGEDDLNELAERLDNEWVRFSKLYSFPDWEYVRGLLRSNQLKAFFSADTDFISYCSHKNAKHISELREFFS